MRVLLDTHTLLWFLADDSRLSRPAHAVILDASNEVLVSMASLWEIVVKASIGKLPLPGSFEDEVMPQLEAERITVLPIEILHLTALRKLPLHHRDPFDRMIVAQAMAEQVPVVTRDPAFRAYGVDVLWD